MVIHNKVGFSYILPLMFLLEDTVCSPIDWALEAQQKEEEEGDLLLSQNKHDPLCNAFIPVNQRQ